MWVGKAFYSPHSFVEESIKQGISKRIADLPSWLQLNKTWILLAHEEVPVGSDGLGTYLDQEGMLTQEPEKIEAVFYAFKPQRVELPVWKDDISSEEILILEKHGVTPVLLEATPQNRKKHKQSEKDWRLLLEKFKDADRKAEEQARKHLKKTKPLAEKIAEAQVPDKEDYMAKGGEEENEED
jgi:hypothetical protein